jgi:hypothetical protein
LSEIKITKCPPGRALGAGDLQRWAHNRTVGRSGVIGQRDKDLQAWARDPNHVTSTGRALTPKQIRKAKRRAERKRQRAERFKQIEIKRKLRTGKLVLWGDKWPEEAA